MGFHILAGLRKIYAKIGVEIDSGFEVIRLPRYAPRLLS